MFCEFLQLRELGNFGVRTEYLGTDQKLRVTFWIFLKQFLNNFTDWIVFVDDTEKNLGLAGIILPKPAFK